jgi:hypothetical protein
LQESGLAIATVHSYWGCLSAFLRIAVDDGIIKAIPKIRLPKLDRRSMSKGRAITGEEFDRMLAAVDEIAPKQAEHWKFLLMVPEFSIRIQTQLKKAVPRVIFRSGKPTVFSMSTNWLNL